MGINKYCTEWVQEWCLDNGWTDLFKERKEYWAFPPHAVMPLPIPSDVLQNIKAEKGLSPQERLWSGVAWVCAVTFAGLGVYLDSPMPLVMAFAICAMIVARMDED